MQKKIDRGKTSFKYAFARPDQFQDWLEKVRPITGVAMIGRSNVGKSSLINALFGNSTARVSKTPGRTREIIVFEFFLNEADPNPFYLFDLPGYGHADVSKEMSDNWTKLMNSFFQQIPKSVLILNIQDARHPDQKADREFESFFNGFNLDAFLILNKLDKLKKQKEKAELKKKMNEIMKEYTWVKQIHQVSAESKFGIGPLESALIDELFLRRLSV